MIVICPFVRPTEVGRFLKANGAKNASDPATNALYEPEVGVCPRASWLTIPATGWSDAIDSEPPPSSSVVSKYWAMTFDFPASIVKFVLAGFAVHVPPAVDPSYYFM
jgi:hypothetical protein